MKPENVVCPECGGAMLSRKNSRTGQRFWGCQAYPSCRGTRNTDGEAPRERGERDDEIPSDRWRSADRDRWRE